MWEREVLRWEYQVMNKSPKQIALKYDVGEEAVRMTLTELDIGEPMELLDEKGGAELLVAAHGSPAEAAEATGVPYTRIVRSRKTTA